MTVCECVRSVLAVYGWVADVVGSRSGMVGELGTRRCVCMVCVWWGLSGGGGGVLWEVGVVGESLTVWEGRTCVCCGEMARSVCV